MKNKWFYYPSFLSKQGLLFKAAKEIMFRGSKYSYPRKAFVKVNLFKQNAFTKIPKSMGGGKQTHGSDFGSWGIVNHLIEEDNPGIYIYYRSLANSIISKKNKFKQLRLELK
tara:strand:+ start:11117 stop:11452 length:336 start_codon:yes stop_codon:yes gene_type:complete